MAEEHTGSIVAFVPDLPDALTVPGGEPASELHVTMVYLTDDFATLSDDHRAAIGSVIREHAVTVDAEITGVRTLGSDDPAATVLLLDSPELQTLRPVLQQAMAALGVPVPEDTYPTFIPHITVGYGTSLDDAAGLVGRSVRLSTLAAFYGPDRDEATPTVQVEEQVNRVARWSAVLAHTGVPTGDGRIIAPGGLTNRDLPLPLLFQPASSDGHQGSMVVGRIEQIDYTESGAVLSRGSFLDTMGTWEAMELVRGGVTGPSVDLDDMTYVVDELDNVIITQARIAGATLVPIPAFANVSIRLEDDGSRPMTADEGTEIAESLFASVTTYARPSASLFENPILSGPMPLTVFDNGQIFGHLAPWDVCHVGFEDCRTAPHSPSGYAYYMTHEEHTDAGVIPVGVLTVGGGHADPQFGFRAALQHYDDVSTAVAHVMVGEDEFGIWAAGRILPWADPVKVEQFRTSPISGDWRRVGGALELIAACSVNTPGFPIPRTRARAGFALVEGTKQMKSLQLGLGQLTRYTGTPEQFRAEQPDTVRGTVEYDQETARAKWAWATKGR